MENRKKNLLDIRKSTFLFLEISAPEDRFGYWFDLFMVVLILGNVAAIVLETVKYINEFAGYYFHLFEIVSVTIFTVEYVLRVWSCCEDPSGKFKKPKSGRLKYMLTPMAIIDLIAILPFYLSAFFGIDLRILRLFRVLRLVKLTRYSPALNAVGATLKSQHRALTAALFVMVMALMFSSSIMYFFENEAQPEKFSSIPMAMWWGMATLTTVGYGDIYPITPIGQLFGIITMVVGIGMFALPAGIIATGFANEMEQMKFTVNWKLVSKVPFFKELDVTEISEIVSLLIPKTIPENYIIIKKGEEPSSMYFILSGQLEVNIGSGTVMLDPGEFFGEMAIVNNSVRTATVTSKTECKLLELNSENLWYLMTTHSNLKNKIDNVILNREK